MKEQEKTKQTKLYKMLPQLKEAIMEYQELFEVSIQSLTPVTARFSSFLPEKVIQIEIKTTKRIS